RKLYDTVVAGNSSTFTFSTAGVKGLSEGLSLSASPSISGLSYKFAAGAIHPGRNANLTVSSPAATPPRKYVLTLAANGGGATRKTNFRLTVFSPARFAGLLADATSTSGFTGMQAGVKVDAGGTVHLVADDDSLNVNEDDVLYFQSNDGGKTFTPPI